MKTISTLDAFISLRGTVRRAGIGGAKTGSPLVCKKNLTPVTRTGIPNYLTFIRREFLQSLKPDAVTL